MRSAISTADRAPSTIGSLRSPRWQQGDDGRRGAGSWIDVVIRTTWSALPCLSRCRQSKNVSADAGRRCTQNTRMGIEHSDIAHHANRQIISAHYYLRVLRASPYCICYENRDHRRLCNRRGRAEVPGLDPGTVAATSRDSSRYGSLSHVPASIHISHTPSLPPREGESTAHISPYRRPRAGSLRKNTCFAMLRANDCGRIDRPDVRRPDDVSRRTTHNVTPARDSPSRHPPRLARAGHCSCAAPSPPPTAHPAPSAR